MHLRFRTKKDPGLYLDRAKAINKVTEPFVVSDAPLIVASPRNRLFVAPSDNKVEIKNIPEAHVKFEVDEEGDIVVRFHF